MQPFLLDPQLQADTLPVTELPLSSVRLARDASYPWILLVPRREGLCEIVDLAPAERRELMDEVAAAAEALRAVAPCDKLNIAALGNLVRQLHVHVVARRRGDAAWPGPVWGAGPATAYAPGAAEALAAALADRLA